MLSPRDRVECVDSVEGGDSRHPAEPGRERCKQHQAQYTRWLAANRQRRRRAGRHAQLPYEPRPRQRRFVGREITAEQVQAITAAVATVAITRAPIDQALANGLQRFNGTELTPLLTALNALLETLGDVTLPAVGEVD